MALGNAGTAMEMQAQREKECIVAFRRLAQVVESLEVSLGNLHDRIQPVLSIEPPSPVAPDKVVGAGRGASSKLANEIHEIAERVEKAIKYNENVMRRIEV